MLLPPRPFLVSPTPTGPHWALLSILLLVLTVATLPAQRPFIQTTSVPDHPTPTRTILVGDEPFPGGIDPETNLHYLLLVDTIRGTSTRVELGCPTQSRAGSGEVLWLDPTGRRVILYRIDPATGRPRAHDWGPSS